jgi:hypothetical protein
MVPYLHPANLVPSGPLFLTHACAEIGGVFLWEAGQDLPPSRWDHERHCCSRFIVLPGFLRYWSYVVSCHLRLGHEMYKVTKAHIAVICIL